MSRDESHSLLKFGLLTSPIEPVPGEIVRFHRLGFDYAEIGIEEPSATPQILMRQKDEILSALSLNRMFAIGHTAYWVGFGSSHEKVRRGWIEEAKDMIRAASELKIGLLNFHYYGRHGMVGRTGQSKNAFLQNFSRNLWWTVGFKGEGEPGRRVGFYFDGGQFDITAPGG